MKRLLALLLLPLIAAVHIHSVYYDPVEHQRGGEFVLLYNAGDQPISVEGWRIATTVSEQDHTLTGSIGARRYYLAADEGFDEHKDNPAWPSPDHEQRITLANNNGFVQLINEQAEIQSTVGWGADAPRSEETPHPGVAKGEALTRINNTGDNARDFTATNPTFPQPPTTSNATLTIHVINTPPSILSVHVDDDEPTTPGVQLTKSNQPRQLQIRVEVEDNNTVSNLTVTANNQALTTHQTSTRANYTGNITYTNEEYIHIQVSDGEHTTTQELRVEQLGAAMISIPQHIDLAVSPGGVATTSIPVRNSANHPVDVHIKGTAPEWAQQLLANITYSIQGEEHPLTNEFRVHSTHLQPEEELVIDIHVHAARAPARAYAGQILIAGSRAQ